MQYFLTWLQGNSYLLVLLFPVPYVWLFVLQWQAVRAGRRYRQLTQGVDGRNLSDSLVVTIADVDSLRRRVDELSAENEALRQTLRRCVQRVGVVRYSPYGEGVSDVNFSVALLDAEDNGVTLSALYGRQETRIYAKELTRGSSSHALSREELKAMSQAKASFVETANHS